MGCSALPGAERRDYSFHWLTAGSLGETAWVSGFLFTGWGPHGLQNSLGAVRMVPGSLGADHVGGSSSLGADRLGYRLGQGADRLGYSLSQGVDRRGFRRPLGAVRWVPHYPDYPVDDVFVG